MKLKHMIVDADICIKIGGNQKYRFLEKLFPIIAEKIYMHKVVYDEIMIPACAKEQVDVLIKIGSLEVVSDDDLDTVEKYIYDGVFESLASVMINPKQPNKNRGEVASIAMAKTKSIAYFATDEKDLQTIIDQRINTGMNDLKCIRIIDIIELIRDGEIQGLKRKEAKALWRLAGKSKDLFDNVIWPVGE